MVRTQPLLILLGLCVVVGCSTTESPLVEHSVALDLTQLSPFEGAVWCDNGDEAFARRAMLHILGRRPVSVVEERVLADMISQVGRESFIRGLMNEPDYVYQWTPFLADHLYVNRIGARFNEVCSQETLLYGFASEVGEPQADLAAHVRDNAALETPFYAEWTLMDLLRSTIVLDDMTPAFRAQLYTRQTSRLIDFHKDSSEVAWRRIYSDLFARTYLGRRLDCLTCHNSEWSVTDHPDAALDRFFPLPGHVEKALFGSSAGRAIQDIDAFFRLGGVFAVDFLPEGPTDFYAYGTGVSPWGITPACGQFIHPNDVGPDPLGMRAYLGADLGDQATIFDLEAILRAGFEGLRGQPTLPVAADGNVAPENALAWMVSSHIANAVWTRVHGSPLTAPHDFPRTNEQRDVLLAMTQRFVQSGYSLRELVVFSLLHPTFNAAAPADCNLDPYVFGRLFNPWVVDDEDKTRENNSVGDLVLRAPSRSLVSAASHALGWRLERNDWGEFEIDESWFEGGEEGLAFAAGLAEMMTRWREFEIDHGAFVMDGETGFRGANFRESLAWEERFGACEDPTPDGLFGSRADYIDQLVSLGTEYPFLDMAVTLKDRLLGAPAIDDEELVWLEAVSGASFTALDEAADNGRERALRRLCAVWLASPQFQLDGTALDKPGLVPPIDAPGTNRDSHCAHYESLFGVPCSAL